jgi:MFS family permease
VAPDAAPATTVRPARDAYIPAVGARRARGRTFSSFRYRNARLFFTGQVISQVGVWLTNIAQALLVYELTHSGVALGVLSACQFLPVLILAAWAGAIADRVDKRLLLLVVQCFAAVQVTAMALLAIMDRPPLSAIYGLALLGGCVYAFDHPTRRSFMVEIVPVDEVQNVVSLNSAVQTAARVIGPTLAGLLVITVGYPWCFALDAVSYLVVVYGLVLMDGDQILRPPPVARATGQIRAGVRYARAVPELWIVLTISAVIGLLAFNFNVTIQLLVQRTFGGSDGTFSLMFAVLSAGSLIGSVVAARSRESELREVIRMALGFGVSLIALAVAPNLAIAFVVAVAVGYTSVIYFTVLGTILQLRSDPVMRGRVLSLQSILVMGTNPIGGPLMGAIGEYIGPRVGVLIGGLACIAAAAWGRAASRARLISPQPITS